MALSLPPSGLEPSESNEDAVTVTTRRSDRRPSIVPSEKPDAVRKRTGRKTRRSEREGVPW